MDGQAEQKQTDGQQTTDIRQTIIHDSGRHTDRQAGRQARERDRERERERESDAGSVHTGIDKATCTKRQHPTHRPRLA
jgi:hypothetical protein